MKEPSIGRSLVALTLFVFLAVSASSSDAQEKFYYWISPPLHFDHVEKESFVIEVSQQTAQQIEAVFEKGGQPGVGGDVVPEGAEYNRNYFAPGQPSWNWHLTAIFVYDHVNTGFPDIVSPMYDAKPSEIAVDPAKWVEDNGPPYVPRFYYVQGRVDPSKPGFVANVSNRGNAGTGEDTLITGFIVHGEEPRNVVVRVLGPSLASAGIQSFLADPALRVFHGSRVVQENQDWKDDSYSSDIINTAMPVLAPSNDAEAALYLTLWPGAYTIHAVSEDGSDGVVLVEVYDVGPPPSRPAPSASPGGSAK